MPLNVPQEFAIEAMVAIGRPGDLDALAKELQKMEKPSSRKPLNEIVSQGRFNF